MDVVETMILVRGLPKGGGWSVLSMAISTDETLTAVQIVERILQQAERLTSDRALKGVESAPLTGEGAMLYFSQSCLHRGKLQNSTTNLKYSYE